VPRPAQQCLDTGVLVGEPSFGLGVEIGGVGVDRVVAAVDDVDDVQVGAEPRREVGGDPHRAVPGRSVGVAEQEDGSGHVPSLSEDRAGRRPPRGPRPGGTS
jgi:hypothetical protein